MEALEPHTRASETGVGGLNASDEEVERYRMRRRRGSILSAILAGSISQQVHSRLDGTLSLQWTLVVAVGAMWLGFFAFRTLYKLRCPSCRRILEPLADNLACPDCGELLRNTNNEAEKAVMRLKKGLRDANQR